VENICQVFVFARIQEFIKLFFFQTVQTVGYTPRAKKVLIFTTKVVLKVKIELLKVIVESTF
jgi:hypothetical protein